MPVVPAAPPRWPVGLPSPEDRAANPSEVIFPAGQRRRQSRDRRHTSLC